MEQSAEYERPPDNRQAPTQIEDDDNIQQIQKFLKLLKQAPNEALMGLIVDSLTAELANKPHRLQTVMEFALKDLPFCEEDFIRLKASEKLLPLYLHYSTRQQADAVLSKYNLAVNSINTNLPKEKQQRQQARALEKFERSMQVLPMGQSKLEKSKGPKYKLMTFESLLYQVCPTVARETAQKQEKEGNVGKIASQFFADLIRWYEPLVASASIQSDGKGASESKNADKTQLDGDSKERTKKQLESAIMGGHQNLKGVKLSDFIDEDFLNDLVHDTNDGTTARKSDKRPLSDLILSSIEKSSISLPTLTNESAQTSQSNKRRRTASGDIQVTHLVMSPILALILSQTEYLMNQDWRRRQIAACNLKGVFSILQRKQIEKLDYFTVQKVSQDNQLIIYESQTVPVTDLIRNVIPRLLLFILKDNFSDFAGLKVVAPAREEAMKLLAEIQINADRTQCQAIQRDVQLIIRILPAIFIAVEKDVWHSRLNFFLIIKALVLRSAPESKMREQILKMFSQLLIMSLPMIEDEPKVAITEILQILLPTYLNLSSKLQKQKQSIVATMGQLLENLAFNLAQSDEVEASSIAVFNLVCRVFDLKDEYKCLSELKFKMHLDTFCPFNFHKIEAVRYSYNLLISKVLAQKEHNLSVDELGTLHTIIIQALAMESSPKIVKLLFKNLELLVRIFGALEEANSNDHQIEIQQKEEQSIAVTESPYASYLRQKLLLDNSLPAWLFDVQPNFESFVFFQCANFESIEGDYFKIVFRPVNVNEWDKFYFDKTENLTKAISIMLANCKNLDAANLIFSMMCSRTLVYDPNPQNNGQFEQRTLLNQCMLHLMMTMDRYTRKLGKQVRQGKRSQILANQDGILDLTYLLGLSCDFLGAQEKDVNVNECWQRDDMQECLHALNEYAMHNNQMILEQIAIIQFYLNDFAQNQNFNFQAEFNTSVEDLNLWIQQIGDGILMNLMFAFYQKYQFFTYFAVEYVSRLKAQAASIILNLASLGYASELSHNSEMIFQVDREFIVQTASEIVKPLLNIVNQERIFFYKKWSAQALVKLLKVANEHNLTVLNRKSLIILVRMMEQNSVDSDSVATSRLKACEFFATELTKQTKSVTVYETYGGVLGTLFLKPSWTIENITIPATERERLVKMWSHAVLSFIRSQEIARVSDELRLRYRILGYGTLVKLIIRAMQILNQSEKLQISTQFPALIDFLFRHLTTKQRNLLIEALVTELEAQSRVAFDSLDRLLETQLISGNTNNMTFFKYLPAFVLPVIKAIQVQQRIYPVTEPNKGIMKILAKLIQLLPLKIASLEEQHSNGVSDQDKVSERLFEMTKKGLEFLAVFAENRIVTEYELIVPMKSSTGIKLREYQKEGINWMAQLGEYNLNCALCDDMGLGKTLQSLCVIFNESEKIKQAQIKQHGKIVDRPCNLVICPNTLTYNWKSEIEKFFVGQNVCVVEVLHHEREVQLSPEKINEYDIVIINYEKVKKCLPQLGEKEFFYLVLDEAHKIKNAKSVIAQSVKQLRAKRKLALSGTPLQNRVAELWSLFDFLMPNFLEEETVFNKTYNKYLTANIKKMSENLEETESFINALKSLKRRIAPFILRRTKEQVLKELPPKVIQDYPCTMPVFQSKVHEEVEKKFPFASSVQQKAAQPQSEGGSKPEKQALRNLILHRKACNHPQLLEEHFPDLFKNQPKMDYTASGKLLGLFEVLQQTEIITVNNDFEETKATTPAPETSLADYATTSPDAPTQGSIVCHRALIFCQMSSCLELVCSQVLDRFGVKYLRLLGSYSARERHQIVNQFNHDSSVRVLILTTQVGGLGLTLTGADIVIFMEHDWNPMNDLQAMDRAHRIGQTKTVNVYRLIMRDTIEDKIMSLQRFKENLAKSLIQARGGDLTTNEVANLELTDLLKSFEEHSGYKKAEGLQVKPAEKEQKPIKGAKMMKQLIAGGIPAVEGMEIAGQAGDTELANIEKIWQAVSDVEEM